MKKTSLTLMFAALAFSTASASPQDPSIAAIVSKDPHFSTLLAALKIAGLDKTLAGKGEFTVFAPTNAAFAKLPKATLNALLKNKTQLTKVLTYHVVAGTYMAGEVIGLRSAKTLEGSTIRIRTVGRHVMINNARVTRTNIEASNGVVHVIDRVLIPKM